MKRGLFISAIIPLLLMLVSHAYATDLVPDSSSYLQISNHINDEGEAIQKVRDLYFQRDFELGYLEGKKLVEKYPKSIKLKAWYLSNMARTDGPGKGAKPAVKRAEELVQENTDNAWSHFALVNTIMYHDERWEEASDLVENAYSKNPGHSDFVWLKAKVLEDNEKYAQLSSFIGDEQSNIDNPANLLNVKGLALMGKSYDEEGDKRNQTFEKALSVFEHVREIDPDNVYAYYYPGRYLTFRKQHERAEELLEIASRLSSSPSVHRRYWQAIMGIDSLSQEEKQSLVLKDIEELTNKRKETANLLFRIAEQYKKLELTKKQEEFENRILEQYSSSVWAEWVQVERYRDYQSNHQDELADQSNEEVISNYKKMLWDFIDYPYHSRKTLIGDAYRNLYHVYMEDSTVSSDTLLQVINGMVEFEGINPHTTHAGGAKLLANRNIHFDRAKEIAREGITLAKEKINERHERGGYESEEEYRESLGWYTGIMYDALGWVYFKDGKLDSARKYLSKAYSLDNDNRQNIYHLGKLNEELGNLKEAEGYYAQGFTMKGRGDNKNKAALKSLFKEMNGDTTGYGQYTDQLQTSDKKNRKKKVLSSKKQNPDPIHPFKLSTLDGNTFSSDKLKGKIVVINIWGKWCGPCVKEMPDIQKLYEKYQDNSRVVVLTINNDTNAEEVRNWMQKKEFSFPVLRDNGYLINQNVYTYPTTWFVSSQGKIAFVKEGYTEELVKEFTWRINALKNN